MQHRDLSGRVVAVTGAAGGLGRALVAAFARRGASVAALDVDAAGLERLAAEHGAAPLLTRVCDLTREDECRDAVAEVVERFGGLDVLVNNAGISHRSLLRSTRAEVIRRVMQVNFFGAVNATHAALESIVARRGAVVAISSVAGFSPLAARAGYSASKHALHGYFDTLRAELDGTGVGVLVVCPSFIRTGIAQSHLGADGAAAQGPRTVVGAALDPDDVAERIARALESGRSLLTVGRVAWLAWWVSRLAPGLYARIMLRQFRAEMGAGD